MGELPHFMAGVPEETLPKQKENSELTKRYLIKNISFTAHTYLKLFDIPKEFIFEVKYINLTGRFDITSDFSNPGRIIIANGYSLSGMQSDENTILQVVLQSGKNSFDIERNFGELSVLLNSDSLLKVFTHGVSTFYDGQGFVTVAGYFIKKSEILTKKNIIL